MAVVARSRWIGAGKPLQPARPVDEIVHRLKVAFPRGAHENLFSFYANDDHYNAVPAEDHTPYSQTGWPLLSPEWWVFATDVMHRPDLGVDCRVLFAYWIAEARAGRMPWLKYMNWQGKQYRAKGYGGETIAFRTAWANSGHFDHIHLSVRTDCRDASLGSWSLTPGGDDDMAFGDEDKARLAHIEAMFTNVYGWTAEDVTLARQVPALLAAIASRVDVDPAELDAIKQAAAAGVVGAVPVIVAAIIAKLPAGAMTRDDVEAAVRDAFAGGLAPGQ